ncbi:hypothetical protein [Jiangella alba]|uniref:Uncharacterized protein n=1 Tax=Jiangella alba TaxID=561176 RepID=A0A1H5PWG4_9ACTN|nr:hypothetical protein [Jiangella alba]SEF17994.1 hypothetical protein SAMN04488561_6164 [Jiangella alba]
MIALARAGLSTGLFLLAVAGLLLLAIPPDRPEFVPTVLSLCIGLLLTGTAVVAMLLGRRAERRDR